MKSNNFHHCDCEYCEYVDLQKSMTSLSITRTITRIGHLGPGNGMTKLDSTGVPLKAAAPVPIPFENSPLYRQWSGLLIALRLFGSCPLSHKKENKDRSRSRVVFRWISWATFYTIVVDIFRITVCIWYYKDWGRFLLGRKYENTLLDWIVVCLNYSIPSMFIWEIVVTWLTCKKGAKLCNYWIDFYFLLEDTFPRDSPEISEIRKWYWIKGIFMGIITVGISIGIFGEIFIGNPIQEFDISHLVRLPPAIFFLIILTVESVRSLFMYFTPADSFKRIRHAIREQLTGFDNVTIPGHIVTSWTKVILAVRTQVKLTGNFQAPSLIPLFLHSMLIFTGLLFFGIKALLTGRGSKHLFIIAVYGGSFICRLILKIIIAENILVEEEAVVDLLLATDSERFDLNGKLEISKIIETLQQKPSKISLNGYITIDKKLITKLMGQIVAYLVVLIQFDLGYYGRKGTLDCSNQTISS